MGGRLLALQGMSNTSLKDSTLISILADTSSSTPVALNMTCILTAMPGAKVPTYWFAILGMMTSTILNPFSSAIDIFSLIE